MKQNDRDMFYSDFNYGTYQTPNMPMMNNAPGPMMNNQQGPMPNMYMNNTMAAGPNMGAPMMNNPGYSDGNIEQRVARLERQIKALNNKITKIETEVNSTNINDIEVNSNMYMI